MKSRQADNGKNIPIAHCLPARADNRAYLPFSRENDPDTRSGRDSRRVQHDVSADIHGRTSVASDPQPSWTVTQPAVGVGDKLVVETNGFRDGLWLDVVVGTPLTEVARLTESFRRVNFGTLEIEVTVDDPKAYTKPWTVKLAQKTGCRHGRAGIRLPRKREGSFHIFGRSTRN
jgi:hypothetical protein